MAQAATVRIDLTRSHTRVTVNAPVQLRRFGQEVWHNFGTCKDICEGGMGVRVDAVFQVGEVVELRFPGAEEQIEYRARIMYRRNNCHYGIKFLDAVFTLG